MVRRRNWLWLVPLLFLAHASVLNAQWVSVYRQNFDSLKSGSRTAIKPLAEWEAGSAAGVVHDGGGGSSAGKFLVTAGSWSSFNRGPILALDLSGHPHDRVRVRFDLLTFGDWRGLQSKTGGPQHRLMFADSESEPKFSFDTNFATVEGLRQSWPGRNPARHAAGTGSVADPRIDTTGKYAGARRWPVEFEYASSTPRLRFTILCGAASGSGAAMPEFGIDNVTVEVRRTEAMPVKPFPDTARTPDAVRFSVANATRMSLALFDRDGVLVRELARRKPFEAGDHAVESDGFDQSGKPVPEGEYEWRSLESPGFRSRFVTELGVNPPSGYKPYFGRSWVGDHNGAGVVCADETGVYIGSMITQQRQKY